MVSRPRGIAIPSSRRDSAFQLYDGGKGRATAGTPFAGRRRRRAGATRKLRPAARRTRWNRPAGGIGGPGARRPGAGRALVFDPLPIGCPYADDCDPTIPPPGSAAHPCRPLGLRRRGPQPHHRRGRTPARRPQPLAARPLRPLPRQPAAGPHGRGRAGAARPAEDGLEQYSDAPGRGRSSQSAATSSRPTASARSGSSPGRGGRASRSVCWAAMSVIGGRGNCTASGPACWR